MLFLFLIEHTHTKTK